MRCPPSVMRTVGSVCPELASESDYIFATGRQQRVRGPPAPPVSRLPALPERSSSLRSSTARSSSCASSTSQLSVCSRAPVPQLYLVYTTTSSGAAAEFAPNL